MGRKPDTDIAMTGSEPQKRLRQRRKPQSKAAEYLSIVYGTWRKHCGSMTRREQCDMIAGLLRLIGEMQCEVVRGLVPCLPRPTEPTPAAKGKRKRS